MPGVAVTLAFGILLIYIATIGNASKLLSLFGASTSTTPAAGTTGTTTSTAATPTTNLAAISAGLNVASPAATNPLLSTVASQALGGSGGSNGASSLLSLTESELGTTGGFFNVGSTAGTTGGLFGNGSSGSSPTYAVNPDTTIESSPDETSVDASAAYENVPSLSL